MPWTERGPGQMARPLGTPIGLQVGKHHKRVHSSTVLGESLHNEDNSVALIRGISGFWYSSNATHQLPFVCEIPPGIHPSKPGKCPTGTFVGLGRDCFAFGDDPKIWLQARDECERRSGSLASIHDRFTNDLLVGQLNSSRYSTFWLGAYNALGSWQWSDSSVFDYTNWSARKWNLERGLVRSAAYNIELASDTPALGRHPTGLSGRHLPDRPKI